MAKAIAKAQEIFGEFTGDCQAAFGDDVVSILLYGSAAGGEYRPGKSDINFMVVLSADGIDRLDRAFPVIRKWRKRKVAVPLFLTERYVTTSLDSFPVEYLGFQRRHVLVYGKDILKDSMLDPEMIRLQCEREIRGKLLILREAFLDTLGRATALKEVVNRSLGAFLAIFQALLFLKGRPVPEGRRELLREAARAFDMDVALFDALMDIKEDKRNVGDREMPRLFMDYLKAVRKLSTTVDEMGGANE
jgi:predicted nucleotidyltransferase